MKSNPASTLFMTIMFLNIGSVVANGGDHNSDEGTFGISFTLEQIYIITLLVTFILAFSLENLGVIKERTLLYKFLGIGVLFLTVDYIIYKLYFA